MSAYLDKRMIEEEKIITGCKKYKKKYQLLLYEKYAPVLGAICNRYASSKDEANDLLQDGFLKIFANIKTYKAIGSFEGWMKRIIINNSISYLKKKNNRGQMFFQINENIDGYYEEEEEEYFEENKANIDFKSAIYNSELTKEEIINVVNDLPDGFKAIFNMYTFDDLKHKEIASILGISVNTSKSQLARARKQLQRRLYNLSAHKKMIKNDR